MATRSLHNCPEFYFTNQLVFHFIQSCQTTYHSQERQYTHWNYREDKNLVTCVRKILDESTDEYDVTVFDRFGQEPSYW